MTTPTDEGPAIRPDVPITLHPDSLAGHATALNRPDTLGLSAMASARAALRLCYESYAQLSQAERDLQAVAPPAVRRQHPATSGGRTEVTDNVRMVNGKPTRVVDAEEFIAAAEQAFKRVSPNYDRRFAELRGCQKALGERVASALDHPVRKTPEGLALATEVRAHVKAMKTAGDRARFLNRAVEAGDLPTVAAVLHAQPFLSGLEGEAHTALRRSAAAKFAPVDSAQLDAVDATVEHVMSAGAILVKRFTDVLALRTTPAVKAAKSVKALAGAGV